MASPTEPLTSRPVIRLRRQIDGALANRWLRILLLVLLIGLFLPFAAPTTHDVIAEGEALVCLALVVLIFLVVPPHVVVRVLSVCQVERKRGPPSSAATQAAFTAVGAITAIPLRN